MSAAREEFVAALGDFQWPMPEGDQTGREDEFNRVMELYDRLHDERAALLAACKALLEAEWMVTHDWGGDRGAVLDAASAAIAKAVQS